MSVEKLSEYEDQLKEIELLLSDDPNNSDLLQLKKDLVDVISLTLDMVRSRWVHAFLVNWLDDLAGLGSLLSISSVLTVRFLLMLAPLTDNRWRPRLVHCPVQQQLATKAAVAANSASMLQVQQSTLTHTGRHRNRWTCLPLPIPPSKRLLLMFRLLFPLPLLFHLNRSAVLVKT